MSYTVILHADGIARAYHCQNKFDAIVLRDALEHRYGACVELLEGATRL